MMPLSNKKSGRIRSAVKFPYVALDNSVAVAKAVHKVGGTDCQRDQLAAQLGQAATSGGFVLRLITARMFGLIMYDRASVSLTRLGQKVCDPQKEKNARVESFLRVPLYKALYEHFDGTTLPANTGLEGVMESLGVPPKQTDVARQAFQRSAAQSGFFEYGNNRLVMPPFKASGKTEAAREDKGDGVQTDDETQPEERKRKLGPLIEGLLDKLPPAETAWPIEARKRWLQTAANIFDLVYSAEGDGDELSITVAKDSAK